MKKLVFLLPHTWKLAQQLHDVLVEANGADWRMADTLAYALASGITMSLEGAEDLKISED